MLCDVEFDCCRRQSRSSQHRPNCLQLGTAGKRTKVVRTESWILRPLPRSSWGYQDRARTMREKFKMKNVASKTDRMSFTVWVKVGFPVGMITQCAVAREATDDRLQGTGHRLQVRREGPPQADSRVLSPVPCHLWPVACSLPLRHSSIGREWDLSGSSALVTSGVGRLGRT